MQVVEVSESDKRPVLNAQIVLALPRKSEAQAISNRAGECGRVAGGNCPASVSNNVVRRIAGELRRLVCFVRLIIAPHEQALRSRMVQVVVQLRDGSVQS